eukprot:gene54444-74589_t
MVIAGAYEKPRPKAKPPATPAKPAEGAAKGAAKEKPAKRAPRDCTVRMLALGADGVLLGRAWAFALAARGEAGVAALLTQIEREIRVVMALTGVTDVAHRGAGMKIDRVEIMMVDLLPQVVRTDAIQSFVSQETPIVRIFADDGAIGVGY